VTYTEDDLRAPWLGPWRLLLFAAIAEPLETMDVAVKINGQTVAVKKAYNSVYPHSAKRTFLGSYVDLSWLKPDVPYEIEVTVPPLAPGQFTGLFLENIEPEPTEKILTPQPLH
jgi:hypothetical protein